jgi:hypothetical protein
MTAETPLGIATLLTRLQGSRAVEAATAPG